MKTKNVIYVPEGGRVDVQALVVEGEPRSPRTSIMASTAFEHSAQTEDLLQVSELAFTGGADGGSGKNRYRELPLKAR